MIRTFALFTLLALAGCASAPSVGVIHTVPPKFSIVPAKSVAVIGDAETVVDLVIMKLRALELYDVRDERELARGAAGDWQAYLDEAGGDVIVRVRVPDDDCHVSEKLRGGDDEDADDVVGWDADCFASLDLFRPRTGERIGAVSADGFGTAAEQSTALADAMTDAAYQIIGGFAPLPVAELILLDEDAPLVREGMEKFDRADYDGMLALWESALTTSPSSAPLLFNLGALCEALRDWKAARAYYSRAIAIAPQVQRYQHALAQLNASRAAAPPTADRAP